MGREKFLNPTLSINSADTYVIRTALLNAIKASLPSLSGTLLDVGCGQMPYRELVLEHAQVRKYIGLDIRNPGYQKGQQPDLFWDGVTIPLAEASVDSVIATELFEHLPDIDAVLREIGRVLKPGGTLFFTVPFLWPLHDSPYDFCRYTPFSLRRHLEGSDFDVRNISALGGWNASLAQMIGLWLNRSGLNATDRARLFSEFEPFYKQLIASDRVPAEIADQLMSPGFQGLAVKRQPVKTHTSQNGRVVVVESGFPVVSETFILDQITGLIDRGVNVENWALKRLTPATTHRKLDEYHLLDRTTYVELPPRALRDQTALWHEEFAARNPGVTLEGITAFHIHFGPTFVHLEPLLNETPAFVMVSFHGYDASQVLKQIGPGYYTNLFRRADLITVPSTAMRELLVAAGCRADKIMVHHYGAAPGEAPMPAADRPGPVRLLTIGRLVEKKGIDDAIRALARLPDRSNLTYRIVGEGPLLGPLQQLIQELHLESCVQIAGFVPHHEVSDLLRQTDVFILTSRTAANGDMEGVPVSLIEAQMAGVPVVSTFHAGIPELVRDQETGLLCDERHVPQIAKALATLIDDPALRQRYGAAARANALEYFNIDRLNDQLAQLVREKSQATADTRVAVRRPASALPLISVCIPTYNRAAYIGDCLRSVLDQADGRIEVLVIDDGSTDNTEEIVLGLGRPEVRYIRKPHTNGSDTRNLAVAEAAGEFLLWVDSDDLLIPGALRTHRKAMRAHPDADVYYGNLKIFGETSRTPTAQLMYEDYWQRNDYLLSLLVRGNGLPHGGTMVRKLLYERVGRYDPEFVRAHDYEFWCRAATQAKIKHVGSFIYLWRWHDSNMSSRSVAMDTSYEARVLKRLVRDHPIEKLFAFVDWSEPNSARIFAYFHLAKAYLKWGDKNEAFAWIEQAVGIINPGWRMPAGSDDAKWKMVNLLVNQTFKDDLQTRTEFARHIDGIRKKKASASAPVGFDRTFYEKKLTQLAGYLKTYPGDVATAEQLKAELLSKTAPRATPAAAPLVSVVIPFYKQADTIAATLDSLGAQTYRAFDILIVSDGDPDFPEAVLARFRQEHPDIAVTFEIKPHSGLAATRNWAIERAQGTYILPLDSDDLIASIFLQKTVAALEANDGLAFVYTETLFFGEKNEIWAHVDFNPRLLLQQNLMTCTTLFRRDVWKTLGGYNTNMTHGYEDWDFWIGAVEHGYRATNIHLPLFMYRRKKQSMLAGREQFDRIAKAQIVANHPTLYQALTETNQAVLDGAAVGRIPEAILQVPTQHNAANEQRTTARAARTSDRVVAKDARTTSKMVSFIVPLRGRREHLDGFVHSIQKTYAGLPYEVILVEQADDLLFKRGQLCNLGFKKSQGDIVVFTDIDIRYLERLDFQEHLERFKRPFVGFDQIAQLQEPRMGEYVITMTEPRPFGFGACAVFSREQFITSNGFSNLIIGWGGEDDVIAARAKMKRLSCTLGHVTHAQPPRSEVNNTLWHQQNVYFLRTDHSRDQSKDSFRETTATELSCRPVKDLEHFTICEYSNITVSDDFAYMEHLVNREGRPGAQQVASVAQLQGR
ncbi:MAG: glycosyltransferase [Acidobacteriota bacterium]